MPATLAPPKLRRRIDLGVPADDSADQNATAQSVPTPQPPISDAAATDLNQDSTGLSLSSGYTAMPTAPSGVMGGDQTQPDDWSRQVQAATAVASKGGPPLSELSAKAGKGPVKEGIKPPAEADKSPPPEAKPQPTAPRAIAKGASAQPVKKAEPVTTPTPTPTPSPTPAATPAQQPTQDGQQPQVQETPPSLQDPAFKAAIQKYGASRVLGKDQDYTSLPPEVTQNENFAGLAASGEPVYFDRATNRFYVKDDPEPGREVWHYENPKYGSTEWTGIEHRDDQKMAIARDAQTRLAAMIQAQHWINDYKTKLAAFRENGNQDINPAQRLVLSQQMGAGTNPLAKAGANAVAPAMGISKEIYDLESSRDQITNLYGQATSKNLPESDRTRTQLQTPDVNDPLDLQERKINSIQERLQQEAAAYYKMYPFANPRLRQAEADVMGPELAKQLGLTKFLHTSGAAQNQNQPAASASPSPSPRPSPSASPSPSAAPAHPAHRAHHAATPQPNAPAPPEAEPLATPTYEEAQAAPRITSQADLAGKKKGYLYRDTDGSLKRLGY